jgi:hypothetical protein
MVKRFKTGYWLLFLAAAIFVFSMSVIWLGDDIDYGYFISDSIWNSHGKINTVSAFFASQANHYWYVNGRFLAHALVQLFCGIAGQASFAAANALIYCAFVYIILYMCGVRGISNNPKAVLTCIVLVLLTFVTKMMPTTQIGFVWMFTLNLVWLRLFIRYRRASMWQMILLCLLSFAAGNGQEALTLGLSAALGLWWLHKRCRIGGARTVMLICYWMGTLAICCSPGTLGRAGGMHISFAQSVVYLLFSLRATYVLLLTLVVLVARKSITLRQAYRQNKLYFNAMAVLFVFNLLIGVYCNRQLFGIELMALIITIRLLPNHTLGKTLNTVALLLVFVNFLCQAVAISNIRRQYADIESIYKDTPKGIIYYDRTLGSTNVFLREYRYYEEIVGQFNNDTHHSLQKQLSRKYSKNRPLHVWPKFLENRKSVNDTVIQYAPQHYYAISLDAKPISTTVHTPQSDYVLDIEKVTVKGSAWASMLIVPFAPFERIDSVTYR